MRILKDETIFILIDVQEKLMPHMFEHEKLEKSIKICVSGLENLKIPMIISEQYKKGLGNTIESIEGIVTDKTHLEKSSFSCCDDEVMYRKIEEIGAKNVVIAGIESHICVLQTAIDLKEKGFNPIVVVDCISSREKINKDIAIERMKSEGVVLTTYEALLFELCRTSKADEFRFISNLIK